MSCSIAIPREIPHIVAIEIVNAYTCFFSKINSSHAIALIIIDIVDKLLTTYQTQSSNKRNQIRKQLRQYVVTLFRLEKIATMAVEDIYQIARRASSALAQSSDNQLQEFAFDKIGDISLCATANAKSIRACTNFVIYALFELNNQRACRRILRLHA